MNSSNMKKVVLTVATAVLSVVTVYCFFQFIKSAGTTSYPGITDSALHDLNVYAYTNLGVSMASLVTVLILVIRNRD
ncbi:MAG: hypothetical protein FD165_1138 [Gammaproteobacteria bacterium]|nr:MAG: hypothetical protein FD165_1138 [Gammaproteobacteria bacterium]TND07297.1 MAG: hypothetical protein FD120_35 [Gammaproteobacteria bacterium]